MAAAAENPEKVSEDGIEDAFDVIGEVCNWSLLDLQMFLFISR